MSQETKLLYAVTAPISALIFLRGQMASMVEAGYDVHLTCADTADNEVRALTQREAVTYHRVEISRDPNPLGDLRGFIHISRTLREVKPDIALAGTPKMSLLCLASAWIQRVPTRIYLCHGLRFEGYGGLKRLALQSLERMLCALATHTVAVSPSLARGLESLGTPSHKINLLGSGSANGVDTVRFRPATVLQRRRSKGRYGVPASHTVVSFVGRLVGDKGLTTILYCADRMRSLESVTLLIVGPSDSDAADELEIIQQVKDHPSVVYVQFESEMENVYWASDVLLLPTKREGLPTVVLEAGACAVPTIAYRATGTVDVIQTERSGILVAQGDKAAFWSSLKLLTQDTFLREQLGSQARTIIEGAFSQENVWGNWQAFLSITAAGGDRYPDAIPKR